MSPNQDDRSRATSGPVAKAIRSRRLVDMPTLEAAVPGRSRRSLFRDLESLGCLSSFTHAGKYHTLPDIPRFDEEGLCFIGEVGFSRRGTLKNTVSEMVRGSPAGRTHSELRSLLRVRVQNTLLDLVQIGEISRETPEEMAEFLYLHPDSAEAGEQRVRRKSLARKPAPPPEEKVIVILAETVRTGRVAVSPELVVRRLRAQGADVSVEEVRRVFAAYDLIGGKKNGTRRRRSSPP